MVHAAVNRRSLEGGEDGVHAPQRDFADEAEANAQDPVLRLIEQPARRETLLARAEQRGGVMVYRLDIRLQGEGETVFSR